MNKEMLYVVLPCYNEEFNIKSLIEEWKLQEKDLSEKGFSLGIVIINDGSSDNTLAIISNLKEIYSNIILINHEMNKGLGQAINTGIDYVLSQEDQGYICIMDGDMTHEPKYVFSMIDKLRKDKLDCVVASRYREGSKIEGVSFYRKFLSYGARVVYTAVVGIPNVRDYTCGYRLYTCQSLRTLAEKYSGKLVSERGFACMMELLVKINEAGFKIGEVPFVLKYQLKGGTSKMRVMKTICRSLALVMRIV